MNSIPALQRLSVFLLTLSSIVSLANDCRGDTNVAMTASLEWKVDSADNIYRATFLADADSPWGGKFKVVRQLKGTRPLSVVSDELVNRCKLKWHVVPATRKFRHLNAPIAGTDWLLFMRGKGELLRISGAINLSHPAEHWDTAAISALRRGDDRVLMSSDEIAKAVQDRITDDRVLPPDCDPELAEQMLLTEFGDVRPPSVYIGAKLLYVSIDVWQQDPLINPLLVPSQIPDEAADGDVKIEANEPERNSRAFFVKANAANPVPRPGEDQWMGTWQADLGDRLLTVGLRRQAEMFYLIELKRGPKSTIPSVPSENTFGAGVWRGDSEEISLYATHHISNEWRRTRQWTAESFSLLKRSVEQLDADSAVLRGGVVFKRQREPLCSYQFPHIHPWHVISEGWGLYRVSPQLQTSIVLDDQAAPVPIDDLVLLWKKRGSPLIQGPPRPTKPRTVRTKLGDNGFEPRITVLRAGDTLEIEAAGSRPVVDHNINVEWFRNEVRGFRSRLDLPLIYQKKVARDEPALMPIQCNIHDDEHGYLAVTDHGNIAVTDEDGYATLSQWPIGRQKLVVIHPDYDFGDAEIWANGEKVEKSKSAIWLDLTNDNIELRIEGAERRE